MLRITRYVALYLKTIPSKLDWLITHSKYKTNSTFIKRSKFNTYLQINFVNHDLKSNELFSVTYICLPAGDNAKIIDCDLNTVAHSNVLRAWDDVFFMGLTIHGLLINFNWADSRTINNTIYPRCDISIIVSNGICTCCNKIKLYALNKYNKWHSLHEAAFIWRTPEAISDGRIYKVLARSDCMVRTIKLFSDVRYIRLNHFRCQIYKVKLFQIAGYIL